MPVITPAPIPVISRPALRPVGKDFTWGELGLDDRLFCEPSDRAALVSAVDQSLKYLKTARRAYPVLGITRDRTERSLRRGC
jgi:hypothetical protein